MERLTRRELWWGSQGKTDKAVNYKVDEERRCVTHEGSTDFLIADRLAEYEDLEEQGKLLKLPCAVGDTVYSVNKLCDGTVCITEEISDIPLITAFALNDEFNKTVFLTRPDAERALEEMEGKK